MSNAVKGLYSFAPFRLDLASRALTKSGQPVLLAPKTFDLLAAMVESQGRLVTKSELISKLWGDAFVEEGNLTFQMSALRKALGEEGSGWIETVPKHGYRFLAPVTVPAAEAQASVSVPPPVRPKWWIAAVAAMAVAAIALGVSVRGSRPESRNGHSEPLRITAYPGSEAWPDLSPDGSQVVFSWNGPDEGNYDLYVKVAGPGEPIRLTDDPRDDLSPAWSPDGQWIAFFRVLDGKRTAIYVKPALGGAERLVREVYTEFWRAEFSVRNLDWTPDGKWLAAGYSAAPGEAHSLWLIPVGAGEVRKLAEAPKEIIGAASPVFAPDGLAVAYRMVRTSGIMDLMVVPLRDHAPAAEPIQVTFEKMAGGSIAWTPDGRALVYSSGHHVGRRMLMRVALKPDYSAAGLPERLSFGEQATSLAMSGNGRLVYAKEMRDANLWRWDGAKGSSPMRLNVSTMDEHTPGISPDGRRIAFASTRSGTEELWISNADGSQPVQITSTNGPSNANPRFSPDGRTILFNSRREGQSDLYLYQVDSGAIRRLTATPAHETQPRWSRDARFIYFASNATGEYQIWRMPATGGDAVQITANQAFMLEESVDGRTLYFGDHGTLWSMPAAGVGPHVVATKVEDDLSYSLNFAVARDGIYYLARGAAPRLSTMKFIDFRTGKTASVLEIDKAWWFGLALGPDGRSLVYSVRDQDGSDLLLIDGVR